MRLYIFIMICFAVIGVAIGLNGDKIRARTVLVADNIPVMEAVCQTPNGQRVYTYFNHGIRIYVYVGPGGLVVR